MSTNIANALIAAMLALPLITLVVAFEVPIVNWVVGVLLAAMPQLPSTLVNWLSAMRSVITLALVMTVAGAQAQSQHAPPGGYHYGDPIGADVLPVLPDMQQDTGLAFIPLAIIVGAGVGIAGWIGIKAVDKVLDIEEMIVTNNAAQVGPLVDQKAYDDYVRHGFTAIPILGRPAFTAPNIGDDVLLQTYPMPVAVDWSEDGVTWVEVKHGITVGDEWEVPDTGVWRARVIPTKIGFTDGTITVTAPPGVLQTSSDLTNWEDHSVNTEDTLLTATPGVFYRVKL